MPCDSCHRRFPLIGSLILRFPSARTGDVGQSLEIETVGGQWTAHILDGPPTHQPTYSSSDRGDGTKKKGKSARCLFCHHVHPLETVKAKGFGGEYKDELLAVADTWPDGRRVLSTPH